MATNNQPINPGASVNIDDTPSVFAGKGGKELFLAHILFALNRWDWLISNIADSGDMRLVPYARSIVTKVSNKDLKTKLLKALSDDIAMVNASDKTASEKNQKILEICQNAISVVYDHITKEHILNEIEVIVPMVEEPPEGEIQDDIYLQTQATDF